MIVHVGILVADFPHYLCCTMNWLLFTQKSLGENNTDRVPHPLDTATRMYCMLSRSDTEKSPDTARTHCCPKVRLLNQPSHRYTSMQFNQRVPTCVAVLSNSTAAAAV